MFFFFQIRVPVGQLLISLGQCGLLSVTSFTEGHGVLVCVGLVFLFFEGYHTNLFFFLV